MSDTMQIKVWSPIRFTRGDLMGERELLDTMTVRADRLSISELMYALYTEPEHHTYAEWGSDGLIYDIRQDRWVLEPHGHEPGTPIEVLEEMRHILENLGVQTANMITRIDRHVENGGR